MDLPSKHGCQAGNFRVFQGNNSFMGENTHFLNPSKLGVTPDVQPFFN
jgi:hypothetical protein